MKPHPRFRVEPARNLPPDAHNHWQVYDFQTGQVARQEDGRLAYFPSKGEAAAFARQANEALIRPGVTVVHAETGEEVGLVERVWTGDGSPRALVTWPTSTLPSAPPTRADGRRGQVFSLSCLIPATPMETTR